MSLSLLLFAFSNSLAVSSINPHFVNCIANFFRENLGPQSYQISVTDAAVFLSACVFWLPFAIIAMLNWVHNVLSRKYNEKTLLSTVLDEYVMFNIQAISSIKQKVLFIFIFPIFIYSTVSYMLHMYYCIDGIVAWILA